MDIFCFVFSMSCVPQTMSGTVSFKNMFVSTDVICVKFFGPYILAGM